MSSNGIIDLVRKNISFLHQLTTLNKVWTWYWRNEGAASSVMCWTAESASKKDSISFSRRENFQSPESSCLSKYSNAHDLTFFLSQWSNFLKRQNNKVNHLCNSGIHGKKTWVLMYSYVILSTIRDKRYPDHFNVI